MEKYFTPEISDIRIGYEGEINWSRGYSETFVPFKITVQNEDFAYTGLLSEIVDAMDDGYAEVKTPYLTKEQIEAEGWSRVDDGFPIQKFKHPTYITMEVIYNYDTHHLFITIPSTIIYTNPPINYRGNNFSGECRCINDFRLICKLLKIN